LGVPDRKRAWIALFALGVMLAAIPAQALQCVPYARAASGIDLRGDAWRWWNAAAGMYERGHTPRPGAVIVFRKFERMRLGHVAVVARIVDSREILIDHANWGPRGAGRGSISTMVAMRDVSRNNDWTRVQVWNRYVRDFGPGSYPTFGFIYPRRDAHPAAAQLAVEMPAEVAALLAGQPAAAVPGPRPSPAAEVHLALADEVEPLQPVPLAAVKVDVLDTIAPFRLTGQPAAVADHWVGGEAAPSHAGSRRY